MPSFLFYKANKIWSEIDCTEFYNRESLCMNTVYSGLECTVHEKAVLHDCLVVYLLQYLLFCTCEKMTPAILTAKQVSNNT